MTFNANQFRLEYGRIGANNSLQATELQESEKSACNRSILYHYTSFDALKKILTNKSLKFNRIDRVNDRLEHSVFGEDELSKLVFVSCFSTEQIESIPMWSIYGKNKNGIRLTIELDKPKFIDSFLHKQGKTIVPNSSEEILCWYGKNNMPCVDWYYTVNMKDVVYDIDAVKRNPIKYGDGDDVWFNLTAMASIKRVEWQYEHECRMIATLRTSRDNVSAPDIDYILVPIKFDNIKKLSIIFNPWMDTDTKEEIKRFINSIADLLTNTFFEDSILTEEITKI